MKSLTLIITVFSILILPFYANSQSVEEETGFKYVKGNYLFDSGRYDEAIQIYNEIVKMDASYEDVLVFRAKAKYALGAYKGTKRDGLAYIEHNGLNEEVCELMGKAELGLGNPLVAISYLDYAIEINNSNSEALLTRGNAYFELEDDVAACGDWHKAKRLGSDKASQQASAYCKRVAVPIDDEPKYEPEVIKEETNDNILDEEEILSTETMEEEEDEVITGDEVLSTDTASNDDDVMDTSEDDYIYDSSDDEDEFPEEDPVFDDEPLDIVVEIVEIDEDLDIKLYDGVGSRKVREVPDIIILSDKAGQVVVDICIDRSGNVSKATLNRKKSTIGSAGLVSLALRKSREFKFERTNQNEQCGKIAFLLK